MAESYADFFLYFEEILSQELGFKLHEKGHILSCNSYSGKTVINRIGSVKVRMHKNSSVMGLHEPFRAQMESVMRDACVVIFLIIFEESDKNLKKNRNKVVSDMFPDGNISPSSDQYNPRLGVGIFRKEPNKFRYYDVGAVRYKNRQKEDTDSHIKANRRNEIIRKSLAERVEKFIPVLKTNFKRKRNNNVPIPSRNITEENRFWGLISSKLQLESVPFADFAYAFHIIHKMIYAYPPAWPNGMNDETEGEQLYDKFIDLMTGLATSHKSNKNPA